MLENGKVSRNKATELVRSKFEKVIDERNEPSKVDPKVVELVESILTPALKQEVEDLMKLFLGKSRSKVKNPFTQIPIKFVHIENFNAAFYSFTSNSIFFNTLFQERLQNAVAPEYADQFREFFIIYAYVHEYVHSQSKTSFTLEKKDGLLRYTLNSGFYQAKLVNDEGRDTMQIGNFLMINEALTELIALMILSKMSVNKVSMRKFLKFGATNDNNPYLLFIYQIIAISKKLAERNGVPVSTIRDALINDYMNGSDLAKPSTYKEIGTAFKDSSLYGAIMTGIRPGLLVRHLYENLGTPEKDHILEEIVNFIDY